MNDIFFKFKRNNDIFALLDENGKVVNKKFWPKKLSLNVVLNAYKLILFSRLQERFQTEINYQKDSNGEFKKPLQIKKVINFLASSGQEACEVGSVFQLDRNKDWFVPGYRNNAAWLTAGYPFSSILRYWLGNERGSSVPEGVKCLPVNIPIATQYSHAVGLAFAEKFKETGGVVMTTIGDGGTSEGEFYEALNFAAIHSLPIIFLVENNQWALDTPSFKGTPTKTFAERANAFAIPNIRVDGNDFFAVHEVIKLAIEKARSKTICGPTLVEFVTYRHYPHSTFDLKKDYFTDDDWKRETEWLKKDPLLRLRNFLFEKKMWDKKKDKILVDTNTNFIKKEIEKILNDNEVLLEDIFNYNYDILPFHLKKQLKEAKFFFEKNKI